MRALPCASLESDYWDFSVVGGTGRHEQGWPSLDQKLRSVTYTEYSSYKFQSHSLPVASDRQKALSETLGCVVLFYSGDSDEEEDSTD